MNIKETNNATSNEKETGNIMTKQEVKTMIRSTVQCYVRFVICPDEVCHVKVSKKEMFSLLQHIDVCMDWFFINDDGDLLYG